MRRAGWCAWAALAAISLAGCGTPSRPPPAQDPAQGRIELARDAIERSDAYHAVWVLADDLDAGGPAGDAARRFLRERPGVPDSFATSIRSRIEKTASAQDPIVFRRFIGVAARHGIIADALAADLFRQVDRTMRERVENGVIPVVLSDDLAKDAQLQDPPLQAAILRNSLDRLSRVPDETLLRAVLERVKQAGPDSAEHALVQSRLAAIRMASRDVDDLLRPVFPTEAARRSADAPLTVSITTEPTDRLLHEDVLAELRGLPGLRFVAREQATLVVTIAKLQLDERSPPDRTQTVVYSSSQAAGVPRNSSYVYELIEGGVELRFAFELKAWFEGREILDDLLRGREEETWRICQNPRVQHPFGGVQPADTFANEQMRSVCSSVQSPVKPDVLRSRVIKQIAAKIQSLAPVETTAKRGR